MKVILNKRLNVGYIEFKKAKIAKTLKFRPNVLIDVDRKGEIVGIEVLDLALVPRLRVAKSRAATGHPEIPSKKRGRRAA